MARRAAQRVEETPEDEVQTQGLDEQAQQGQSRTGQITEGELELARTLAKRMGWTPKEDWRRDPDKWQDAPDFLERTTSEVETLKERNRALEESKKRTAQAAADAIEEANRR